MINSNNTFDLGYLGRLRQEHVNNPIMGYLNINSLRYKIIDLRHVLSESQLDIVAISETKLSDEFPDGQFIIDGYCNPAQFRKDRNKHGGGLVVYVKTGIPVKRVKALEPANLEIICIEITIAKRKWLIYSFYRSETFTKLPAFLDGLQKSVDMAINKYDNIILMGDMNVDMSNLNNTSTCFYDVNEFCDIFDLTNLIKKATCLTPTAKNPSLIDIILTNRPRSFKNSVTVETGLSDHHRMVLTVLRCHHVRLQPTTIHYRDYNQFSPDAFIAELQFEYESQPISYTDPNLAYNEFCNTFKAILDKHAPLKSKVIRGNQAPFMSKELSKGIMTRSRLKNKFNKHKTKENWKAYKIQRNKCVHLRKKAIQSYFHQNTNSGNVNNKSFWKTIRPFINNKGTHDNHDIILEENGDLVKDKEKVSEILNNFYINIVEKTTGKQPLVLNSTSSQSVDDEIDHINGKYENHESIKKIKEHVSLRTLFSLNDATEETILKILLSLDVSKGSGYDTLPPKIIKLAAPIITTPLTNIINLSKLQSKYPDMMKVAYVAPAFKKEDRLKKENYRPISILNTFSKVFERYILGQLMPFFDETMSQFLSAYRKNFSCQNVLLRLIEQWRQYLDNNKVVGAVLMDLSKAFDCLPHELLIAKLEAYGLDRQVVKLIYSYLKDRKQTVKIKGFFGVLKTIISGVPQGSILGPILFNIFINDLFLFIEGRNLHNFADDNTLSDHADSIDELKIKLERLSNTAIDWMDNNYMIANPSKFHAILFKKNRTDTAGEVLKIKNNHIQSESEVDLLGLTIDNRLSFNSHISSLCKKASNQLNALKRLGSSLNFTQRKALAQAFILANFNYCPTIWHFCSMKDQHKIEKIQQRTLRFIYADFTSTYSELLNKAESCTLELRRIRFICTEIYKTVNRIGPAYMNSLITPNQSYHSTRRPLNLFIPQVNQTTFGLRSFRYQGTLLWNSLPEETKTAPNLNTFKKLIKNWSGPACKCNFCSYYQEEI